MLALRLGLELELHDCLRLRLSLPPSGQPEIQPATPLASSRAPAQTWTWSTSDSLIETKPMSRPQHRDRSSSRQQTPDLQCSNRHQKLDLHCSSRHICRLLCHHRCCRCLCPNPSGRRFCDRYSCCHLCLGPNHPDPKHPTSTASGTNSSHPKIARTLRACVAWIHNVQARAKIELIVDRSEDNSKH